MAKEVWYEMTAWPTTRMLEGVSVVYIQGFDESLMTAMRWLGRGWSRVEIKHDGQVVAYFSQKEGDIVRHL